MSKRKRILLFIFSLLSFAIIAFLFFKADPNETIDAFFFSFSPLIPFFIFLSLALFSLLYAILKAFRRPLLITIFITGILLLRWSGITDVIHAVFLFVILLLIELFFDLR